MGRLPANPLLPSMRRRKLLPYVWMLLGTFAFAVMAVLINELKEEVPWQWMALARSSLAMPS